MKSLGRYALRLFLRTCARSGWYGPFIWILSRTIVEHPVSKAKENERCPTLLALSPEGFRGDLDVLSESGHFRVLLAPTRWQTRLMYLFYPERLRSRDYLNPEPRSPYAACKNRLQAFYKELLPRLYARLGIDAVISYHVRAPADVDWGVASDQTGYPYVVLYREGLIASSPRVRETMTVLFGKFGFWGTHLVVHNESARQFCVDAGLARPEMVSSLGCLRMDGLIHRIEQQARFKSQFKTPRHKRVALFPISLTEGSKFDLSLMPVFSGIHVGIAKLAIKHPDVDFVMKPKPKVHAGWRKLFDRALAAKHLDFEKIPNLRVDTEIDAQELILESDVIVGLNSTTLLEAAIAGKAVVIPYFRELQVPPYRDNIRFSDAFQYLDVAADADSFMRLIEERLVEPSVSPKDMAGRRKMFEKYVSDPDGRSLGKYTQLLNSLIERHGKQHRLVPSNTRSATTAMQVEDFTP